MISNSLLTRLLLAVGMLAITVVCAMALSARHWTHAEFNKFQRHALTQPSRQQATEVASLLGERCCSPESMQRAVAELDADQAILVVDSAGRLITAAGSVVSGFHLRQIQTRMEEGALRMSGLRESAGKSRLMTLQIRGPASARVTMADGRPAWVYVIRVPEQNAPEPAAVFLGSLDRRLLLVASLVGVLALGAVWVIARRFVKPIGELNEAARDIARGNLARRVDAEGSDEVAALARTFNTMASELQRQQMLQRHLVQDIAHELRTPLTALQCRLETMLDGFAVNVRQTLGDATEEVKHLSRLLDDLQDIAIAETRQLDLRITTISMAEVTLSAVRVAGLEHDPRLRMEIDGGLQVQADVVRARQVMINLLTNARRHTPTDGEIIVRASRESDAVTVEVRNTGSSLDAEQLQRIFDRFYRGDPARQRATGGTGLGLTIVKHFVEAHGGEVSAASDSTSVTIRFTLPAGPAR
jgi:signal transduction histidine kinase